MNLTFYRTPKGRIVVSTDEGETIINTEGRRISRPQGLAEIFGDARSALTDAQTIELERIDAHEANARSPLPAPTKEELLQRAMDVELAEASRRIYRTFKKLLAQEEKKRRGGR